MWRWVAFLGVFMGIQTALAQESPGDRNAVIFIMDASGSMSQKIDGETKIDSVTSALSPILEDLDNDANIGLVAYGHRNGSDCEDIETLVSFENSSKSKRVSSLKSIVPKGRTPLTASVKHAASALKGERSATSIVLITDGLDTCGEDPCALGRDLAESGSSPKTHVIGFDLEGRNTSTLQCLALETGGTYMNAGNGTELNEALKKVTRNLLLKDRSMTSLIEPPLVLITPAPVPEK